MRNTTKEGFEAIYQKKGAHPGKGRHFHTNTSKEPDITTIAQAILAIRGMQKTGLG